GERVGGGCEGGGGRGAGRGPRGCGSQMARRADPGVTPPATKGWPWSGHRGTRKREKPVARWTGAYLLLASALARHTPSFGGMGKETGKPQARPNLGLMKLGSLTMEYVSEAVVAGVAPMERSENPADPSAAKTQMVLLTIRATNCRRDNGTRSEPELRKD